MAMLSTRRFVSSRARDDVFAAALDSLTAQVAIVDGHGTILAVNDAWRRFAADNGAGGHPSLVEGANYLACTDADDDEATAAARGVRAVIAGETGEFRLEYPCHSPGEERWFELRATPLRDRRLTGAVIVHSSITQRKLAEQRLHFLATHDELTGLSNRRDVFGCLEQRADTGSLGILLADLDHFKAVNDSYGHAAGNDVLRAVADGLRSAIRGGSMAGRLGGDEFCLLQFESNENALHHAAEAIADRVREQLATLPFGQSVSISVGGTLVRAGEPVGDAMRRADVALYDVKRAGRAGFLID